MCESDLSVKEIKDALFSMKTGKSPGIDGISVEFYTHFGELLHNSLCVYKEYQSQGDDSYNEARHYLSNPQTRQRHY